MTPVYNPGIFDVGGLTEARHIILTPEPGISTEQRWQTETPAVADWIIQMVGPISEDSIVLDYGCGIGRLSKALIDTVGCAVVGVDLSASMRALAAHYVDSPKFLACAPEMLPVLRVACDVAISVWTLQHCLRPERDITLIADSLKPSGKLFVLNLINRCVPTDHGWVDDGMELRELLKQRFAERQWRSPTAPLSQALCDASFIGAFDLAPSH